MILMSDLISSSADTDEKNNTDFMGALKFAGVVIVGLLTIIGLGWEDLLGFKEKVKPKIETKRAASIDENEGSAKSKYERDYLDENDEDFEEELDRHETGIS